MSDFGTGEELLELASVQQAINQAAAWSGGEHARRVGNFVRAYIGFTFSKRRPMESPLEAIFYAWFNGLMLLEDATVYLFNLIPQEEVVVANGRRYRFDFLVEFGPQDTLTRAEQKNIPQPKLVIELDGHEFHEKTKEQVALRNERDRDLQGDGWTVLHFSGSELYRDPLKCVESAYVICKQKTDAWSRAVYGE